MDDVPEPRVDLMRFHVGAATPFVNMANTQFARTNTTCTQTQKRKRLCRGCGMHGVRLRTDDALTHCDVCLPFKKETVRTAPLHHLNLVRCMVQLLIFLSIYIYKHNCNCLFLLRLIQNSNEIDVNFVQEHTQNVRRKW